MELIDAQAKIKIDHVHFDWFSTGDITMNVYAAKPADKGK